MAEDKVPLVEQMTPGQRVAHFLCRFLPFPPSVQKYSHLYGCDSEVERASKADCWGGLRRRSARCLLQCSILCLCAFTILSTLLLFWGSSPSSSWRQSAFAPLPFFDGWSLLNRSDSTLMPNCPRVLHKHSSYVATLAQQRLTYSDPQHLDMDCASGIRRRNYFPQEIDPEDRDFPLAQARIVYKDYVFLEKELAAVYSPHNWYCYAIDHKSTELFHSRMRQLAQCLPNVIVSPREWVMDGGGHNITSAHLECLRLLNGLGKKWEYVALLQNHDVAIKTNREMVQIYRWLNGANDVEITSLPGGRVNASLDWSFEAIHMFRNESRNSNSQPTPNGYPPVLVFSKGYVESSLSRAMVNFMLEELDLTESVRRLEAGGFGIDEILIPTLHAADALQTPGGFTRHCMDNNVRVQHITRVSIWYDLKQCGSGHMRHSICVFGMEDLADKLAVWPHLFANKLMPDFDFGALLCWWEEMHRRAYLQPREHSLARLDADYYAELPHVRFQTFLAKLARLNEGQRRPMLPYREAIRFFNCTFDEKNAN